MAQCESKKSRVGAELGAIIARMKQESACYEVVTISNGKKRTIVAARDKGVAMDCIDRRRLDNFFGEGAWYKSRNKQEGNVIAAWYSSTGKDRYVLVYEHGNV